MEKNSMVFTEEIMNIWLQVGESESQIIRFYIQSVSLFAL